MNFITGKIKGKNSLNQIGKDYFNNEKKNEDNDIINQVILNNPDILKDFKKKQSKTPNKKINPLISIANSDNFRRKIYEREYIGNSRKNSKNKFLTGNQKNIKPTVLLILDGNVLNTPSRWSRFESGAPHDDYYIRWRACS